LLERAEKAAMKFIPKKTRSQKKKSGKEEEEKDDLQGRYSVSPGVGRKQHVGEKS